MQKHRDISWGRSVGEGGHKQFTKLQALKTFKQPAHDVWGFYSSRKETEGGLPASPKQKKYHVFRILIWLPPRCRICYSETCSMDGGKERVEISLHEWAEQPSDLLPPGSKARIKTLLASTKWCHWGLPPALSP